MNRFICFIVVVAGLLTQLAVAQQETLPQLKDGKAPQNFQQMWAQFDPCVEPLDTEILKQWEEDGVILQVLRYRIGIFKGQKAMMAGIYGYPKGGTKLPGLVQIHGGGQYADYRAVLTNAKRGYATISISWAGRINAPGYNVNPNVVKLFWDGKTEDPQYKLTTDWGALDGYHAPCRNPKNNFASVAPAPWTLDEVESPRNNPWFLSALGARRALTFLQQQPQVDPDKLGVYGHSMGGKLTVMTTAADPRVKASAPSCGGISDRNTGNTLYDRTIVDDVNLRNISCPIIFLSPSNDFHGRIDDLQKVIKEIKTNQWRVTCSPHHNHQDTSEYEVASLLWFDQYLKNKFVYPKTPKTSLRLNADSGTPSFTVNPDSSKPILSVDIYYTQQGQKSGEKNDIQNTIARFWHHAAAKKNGNTWIADLPLTSTDKPLWVYANVLYPTDEPVTGAGYYYRVYRARQFNLSSTMHIATADQLKTAGVKATVKPSLMIETFKGDWQKHWFTYRPEDWALKTHKVYADKWKAPSSAKLAFEVRAEKPNKLVVGIDKYAAEIQLTGKSGGQRVVLSFDDFHNAAGDAIVDFEGIKELRLGAQETLREKVNGKDKALSLGAIWQGGKPKFRNLRWIKASEKVELNSELTPDTMWTYKQTGGKDLQMSVFLPDNYDSAYKIPTIVIFHGGSWNAGDPSWHYPDCAYWSKRGMIAVSVDYRLKDRDSVDVPLECVKDAKSAIRFLRKNAKKLKVDPQKIVVAGGSAGAQLAAATATITSKDTNDDCYDISITCKPNVVLLWNPWFKCHELLSPPKHIAKGLPPFITFSGGNDKGIPVSEMVEFHQLLQKTGNASELYIGKSGAHGLCNGRNKYNRFFYWSLELTDQFLIKHGILSGTSIVTAPETVTELKLDEYEVYN